VTEPLAFSVSPAGSVPTIENVYGAVPPVGVSAPLLNATPCVPAVIAEQAIEGPAVTVTATDEPAAEKN